MDYLNHLEIIPLLYNAIKEQPKGVCILISYLCSWITSIALAVILGLLSEYDAISISGWGITGIIVALIAVQHGITYCMTTHSIDVALLRLKSKKESRKNDELRRRNILVDDRIPYCSLYPELLRSGSQVSDSDFILRAYHARRSRELAEAAERAAAENVAQNLPEPVADPSVPGPSVPGPNVDTSVSFAVKEEVIKVQRSSDEDSGSSSEFVIHRPAKKNEE